MKLAIVLESIAVAAILATAVWQVASVPDSRCYRRGDSTEWKQYCLASAEEWRGIP